MKLEIHQRKLFLLIQKYCDFLIPNKHSNSKKKKKLDKPAFCPEILRWIASVKISVLMCSAIFFLPFSSTGTLNFPSRWTVMMSKKKKTNSFFMQTFDVHILLWICSFKKEDERNEKPFPFKTQDFDLIDSFFLLREKNKKERLKLFIHEFEIQKEKASCFHTFDFQKLFFNFGQNILQGKSEMFIQCKHSLNVDNCSVSNPFARTLLLLISLHKSKFFFLKNFLHAFKGSHWDKGTFREKTINALEKWFKAKLFENFLFFKKSKYND